MRVSFSIILRRAHRIERGQGAYKGYKPMDGKHDPVSTSFSGKDEQGQPRKESAVRVKWTWLGEGIVILFYP